MILLTDSRSKGVKAEKGNILWVWVVEKSSILVTNPGPDKRMSFLLRMAWVQNSSGYRLFFKLFVG